jgi:hypothetical protein
VLKEQQGKEVLITISCDAPLTEDVMILNWREQALILTHIQMNTRKKKYTATQIRETK